MILSSSYNTQVSEIEKASESMSHV